MLGVIRPTTESIGNYSHSGNIGILATPGTVQSGSYPIEIQKFFPELKIEQEACPMWVPLVENGEHKNSGADYFVAQHIHNILSRNNKIDTLLLACTHYPLLEEKIKTFLPEGVSLLSQGSIVAESLKDYLQRHPEMEGRIERNGVREFYTTDSPEDFDARASIFYGGKVKSGHVDLAQPDPV